MMDCKTWHDRQFILGARSSIGRSGCQVFIVYFRRYGLAEIHS
ncbi:MAG: hypothetical protein ACTSPQ_11930 [Candidatus Helarchaeota archaeon]